jgi:hypothetical protein
MDIHKPKPIHNWREFLKEYAIIVIGVLTALAAEQAVEWLHWQDEVTAARASLRSEMSVITNYYGQRVAIAGCVDKKLDSVGAIIAEVAAGLQPNMRGVVFRGLGAPIYDSEWQSERSSQVLTHFPRDELAAMSTLYGQRLEMHDWSLEEAAAWAGLAVLQDAAQKLGPADLAQLRINYRLAMRYQNAITLNARRQLAVAAKLGLEPATLTPAQIAERCN